jgi:hypothetical protein
MKLSETTIEFLKNFSTINQGLVVKKGNVIKTLASNKNIKAEATIEETFDKDFAIYDLTKTLGILSMNKDNPEVFVEKECLTFTGAGTGKIHQRFSPSNMIAAYASVDEEIPVYEFEANLVLTEEVHRWILSVASILKCPNIVFRSVDGKSIQICAEDIKGAIADDASITVMGMTVKPFQGVMKLDNFKIIWGSYNVAISKAGLARFNHIDKKITYWISLEEQSKF